MVTLKGVQETYPRVPICGIDQLIYLRHRERVLRACSVQICEIYTNPPFAVLLPNYDGIYKPFREEDFLYRPGLFQPPDLLPYYLDVFLSQPSQFLLLLRK